MRITNLGMVGGLLFTMSALVYADIDIPLLLEPVQTKIHETPLSEKKQEQRNAAEFDGFVDYVLVKKRERKLHLYAEDRLVKSYKIALGKQPKGQKVKEGDSRTPEGLYTLDWRNPNSKFFRSIHVSYPNVLQSRSAKEAGVDPGGAIMIHGQPSDWSERIKLTFSYQDWTEGCIALENQDMIEVWDLVRDGTPIKIDP
ncbi:MAG: L,D-transpeptidase family protein [Gammaproteobacteria bacterium]|nr:L,D-transpeptidase family protein [Gammaproteobacteria bacterium]